MAWTSFASKAAASRPTSSRSAGEPGCGGGSACGRLSSVARARLSALVTDSTLESSILATSAARKFKLHGDVHLIEGWAEVAVHGRICGLTA
jgi:hypothetical protein